MLCLYNIEGNTYQVNGENHALNCCKYYTCNGKYLNTTL